ncbi:hypothetical protein CCYN49044_710001 [Capnocytophaga cynodegmi]|nr:hypothetical protein CCYN49044_710001 [Capnocytophaga cynodegmi]
MHKLCRTLGVSWNREWSLGSPGPY